jgi:hypothetical protein
MLCCAFIWFNLANPRDTGERMFDTLSGTRVNPENAPESDKRMLDN